MHYNVFLLAATIPAEQQIQVLPSTASTPGGFTNIGNFYHGVKTQTGEDANGEPIYSCTDDASDDLHYMVNHRIEAHVEEILNALGIVAVPEDQITIFNNGPTATPTFSPAAGSYSSTQSVTIADSVVDAEIYFTLDGTTPTTASTPYSGPISVAATATVKAIAVGSGFTASAVGSAAYTIT